MKQREKTTSKGTSLLSWSISEVTVGTEAGST